MLPLNVTGTDPFWIGIANPHLGDDFDDWAWGILGLVPSHWVTLRARFSVSTSRRTGGNELTTTVSVWGVGETIISHKTPLPAQRR